MTNLTILPKQDKKATLTIFFDGNGEFTYKSTGMEETLVTDCAMVFALEFIKQDILNGYFSED